MLDVLRIPYLRKRFILMSLIWCVPLSHIYFIDFPLTIILGKVTRLPLHICFQDLNQSRLLRPEPERRQFRHEHLHHAAGVRRRRGPRQPAEFYSQPAHREEADAVGLADLRRRHQPLDPRHPQRYAGGWWLWFCVRAFNLPSDILSRLVLTLARRKKLFALSLRLLGCIGC